MKQCLTLFAIVASFALAQHSAAQESTVITQVVTSGGSTGDLDIVTDATLISFVSNGITYDEFIGLGVIVGVEPERIFANEVADAGTATAAVSDLNLATGTLNTNRNSTVDPVTNDNLQYDLTGQVLDATTTLFIFTNGIGGVNVDPDTGDAFGDTSTNNSTPPNTLTFLDAAGNAIGTIAADYFFSDPGPNTLRAPNLMTFDVTRTRPEGGNLDRSIAGATFTLGDIAFTSGGIEDVVGFTHLSGSADILDFGIAFPADDVLLGDADCNDTVDFLDIAPFIALLTSGEFKAEADIDGNGVVDFLDIAPFIAILTGA